jgi:Methylamine utilisation protein MauE
VPELGLGSLASLAQAADVAGRLVVAGALGWAAAGKLADLPALRATLYLSRLTRPWVPQVTAGLPATELVLAAGLVSARAGWVAACAAAVLMVAFTGYLAVAVDAGQGCNCFGGRTHTSRRAGILRDLLLLAALSPALLRGPGATRWGVPEAAEPWAGAGALVVIAGLLWWTFRRDAAGRRSGAAVLPAGRRRAGVPPVPPPAVRRESVPFEASALDGGRLRLADLAARPGGVLLVFAEPGCALCETLLPELAGRADVVVLAGVRDAGEVPGWAAALGLPPSRVAADVDGRIADAYRVPASPAAARVDATGLLVDGAGAPVARLAVGPAEIRQLLAGDVEAAD